MPVKAASLSVCDDSVYCSLWSCGVEASLSDNITRRYQDPLRALQSQGDMLIIIHIVGFLYRSCGRQAEEKVEEVKSRTSPLLARHFGPRGPA